MASEQEGLDMPCVYVYVSCAVDVRCAFECCCLVGRTSVVILIAKNRSRLIDNCVFNACRLLCSLKVL